MAEWNTLAGTLPLRAGTNAYQGRTAVEHGLSLQWLPAAECQRPLAVPGHTERGFLGLGAGP
jgi:hypothetical protein